MIPVILIVSIVIFCDQLLKIITEKTIPEGQSVHLYKRLYLTNHKNKGVALGFFRNSPKLIMYLVVGSLSLFTISYLLLIKRKQNSPLSMVAYALVLGGGISNIIDRLRNKYVTDYLSIKSTKPLPIFNLADIFIAVGALVFFIKELKSFVKH